MSYSYMLLEPLLHNVSQSYGNCPKLFIKGSDKMAFANSADPDQTAPVGAV